MAFPVDGIPQVHGFSWVHAVHSIGVHGTWDDNLIGMGFGQALWYHHYIDHVLSCSTLPIAMALRPCKSAQRFGGSFGAEVHQVSVQREY